MLFVAWIILSVLVGFIGQSRKIGFGWAFIAALFLSPLIGLIFALASSPEGTAAEKVEAQRIKEHDRLVKAAMIHMNRKETERAMQVLQSAIQQYTGNPSTYYNLACMYALQRMKNEAFHNLSEAVAKGYSRIEAFTSDPDLEFLRMQPEWAAFERNGYKMRDSHDLVSSNRVEQLEKLAKLKSDGVLSQEEFEAEKKRLLAGEIGKQVAPPPQDERPASTGGWDSRTDMPMR